MNFPMFNPERKEGGLEHNNKDASFTLIELLIVVAIIAIYHNRYNRKQFSGQRQGDAKRKEDLSNIQKALTEYYAVNGYYPPNNPYWCSNIVSTYNPQVETALLNYINPIPRDSLHINTINDYYYGNIGANSQHFQLGAMMELASDYSGSFTSGGCQLNDGQVHSMTWTYSIQQ